MRAVAGARVRSAANPEVTGYVSARLAAGMLGVIRDDDGTYCPVLEDDVVVVGEHLEQWDRHGHVRSAGL